MTMKPEATLPKPCISPSHRKRKIRLEDGEKQVTFTQLPPHALDCCSPYYLHDDYGIDLHEEARRKALIWYSVSYHQVSGVSPYMLGHVWHPHLLANQSITHSLICFSSPAAPRLSKLSQRPRRYGSCLSEFAGQYARAGRLLLLAGFGTLSIALLALGASGSSSRLRASSLDAPRVHGSARNVSVGHGKSHETGSDGCHGYQSSTPTSQTLPHGLSSPPRILYDHVFFATQSEATVSGETTWFFTAN